MKKIILFFTSLALLSSCTPLTWYKNTARPGEFEQDKYTCTQQSQQQYSGAQVNAYGGTAVNKVITNDNLFTQCMNAKGWSLQRQENAQALVQQQQAVNQQRQYDQNQRNAEIKKAFDDFRLMVQANCTKTELKEYYAKSACTANEITFAQIADDTKITKEQKIVLPKQRESVAETQKIYKELQIKYYGDLGRRRSDLLNKTQVVQDESNNLDLFNGKITWGEYNKKRKAISAEFGDKLKEIK